MVTLTQFKETVNCTSQNKQTKGYFKALNEFLASYPLFDYRVKIGETDVNVELMAPDLPIWPGISMGYFVGAKLKFRFFGKTYSLKSSPKKYLEIFRQATNYLKLEHETVQSAIFLKQLNSDYILNNLEDICTNYLADQKIRPKSLQLIVMFCTKNKGYSFLIYKDQILFVKEGININIKMNRLDKMSLESLKKEIKDKKTDSPVPYPWKFNLTCDALKARIQNKNIDPDLTKFLADLNQEMQNFPLLQLKINTSKANQVDFYVKSDHFPEWCGIKFMTILDNNKTKIANWVFEETTPVLPKVTEVLTLIHSDLQFATLADEAAFIDKIERIKELERDGYQVYYLILKRGVYLKLEREKKTYNIMLWWKRFSRELDQLKLSTLSSDEEIEFLSQRSCDFNF